MRDRRGRIDRRRLGRPVPNGHGHRHTRRTPRTTLEPTRRPLRTRLYQGPVLVDGALHDGSDGALGPTVAPTSHPVSVREDRPNMAEHPVVDDST
ncbi:hypothetical protein [Streptomyces sp. NPDC000618]|uniref:hypothetical protein n=1 Tax=Streptomyces sp. NPDC000618 TaxID=3154265 RepID=UPI0033172F60